jgi:hypothetical protein
MLAAQVGCLWRGRYALGGRHWAGRAGLRACRCGLVTPAAGVLASLLLVPGSTGPACGGRRDPPGVSREADAMAVTLGEFLPSSRRRVLRAYRRLGAAATKGTSTAAVTHNNRSVPSAFTLALSLARVIMAGDTCPPSPTGAHCGGQ